MKFRTKLSILFILVGIVVLILLTFLPILTLRTKTMQKYESDHFIIYYEPEDKKAVEDIAQKLIEGYNKIAKAVDLSSKERTKIYIYKFIEEFHIKRYGLLYEYFAEDWYTSDHDGNIVVSTSPYSPGKNNDYQTVVDSIVHEFMNTIVSYVNPRTTKFLNEGVAGYVSGDSRPVYPFTNIPKFRDTKISNETRFANTGMYQISYTYIEFLDSVYGMNKVFELIKTMDYEKTFGKSEETIFDEWIRFIEQKYLNGRFASKLM